MKNIKKSIISQKSKLIKYTLLLAGIIMVYVVCLAGDRFGAYELASKAGIKMQRLVDGEWKTYGDLYAKDAEVVPLGEIVDGMEVRQRFTFTEEMLENDILCFAIYAATYDRVNVGEAIFMIEQGDDFAVECDVDMAVMEDNEYIRFLVETDGFKPGEAVMRCFSYDGQPGNAITVYMTDYLGYDDYISVGGNNLPYNLKMKIYVPF